MDIVLYFRPSPTSNPEKLAGVREIAEKARIHVQVIDDAPTKERVRALRTFPSLPVENSKIAFPPKPACVFRLRAS